LHSGGCLRSMNISPRKEEGSSYPYFKSGREIRPT
jgi:hypothetical protein